MHQVRYFLALCAHGGFSRAAEACEVSQPALTTAIRRLEEELGGPLFHRGGKRVTLTQLGQMVRPHLEQLRGGLEAASEVARNFRLLRDTPLRAGVMPSIGPRRIVAFLRQHRTALPQAEVALSCGPLPQLLERLEGGELDCVLASSPQALSDTFRTQALYRERYVVVVAQGHRFERQPAVALAEVDGEPYVDRLQCELREAVMGTCRERSVSLYASYRSEREDWIEDMVAAGLGFAFMPEYSVRHAGVVSRPLHDPQVERTVLLVDLRGHQRSPGTQAFATGLAAFCRAAEA